MKEVIYNKKTHALILSASDFQPGMRFVSEPDWPLQVGLLMPAAGHAIAAHVHLPQPERSAHRTQEFLIVLSGSMEVDFFNEARDLFHTETVRQGEALFHILGGHAFRFLEETRLLEIKSGPYLGREKDKVFLNSSL